MRKRLTEVLTGLAALALVGVGAVPASAHVTGACVYLGASSQLPAVGWVGGTGNFYFQTSLGACAGEVDGTPTTAVLGPPFAGADSLTATGTFSNVVCGTGVAVGTAELTAGPLSGTSNFTIPFVAGQGVSVGTYTSFAGDGAQTGFVEIVPNNNDLTPIFGGMANDGYLIVDFGTLVPTISGVCPNQYAVAGAFAVDGI